MSGNYRKKNVGEHLNSILIDMSKKEIPNQPKYVTYSREKIDFQNTEEN